MTLAPMAVPVIPIITAGSIVGEYEMNQLSYAAAFLMSKPMTRVYDSIGGQSLGNEGSSTATEAQWTAVKFNNSNFDVDGAWPGSGSNDNELVIQTSGWYKVRYSVNINNNSLGPCNAAVISTSGSNNPSGAGVTSPLCMGSMGFSGSQLYLGSSGIFPLFLYGGGFGSGTGDNIQVVAISSGGSGSPQTSTGTISGGPSGGSATVLNPGSSLSIEWVSAG